MIESVRLLRGSRAGRRPRHGDLLLDARRVLLLVWVVVVTALPLLLRRLFGIRDRPADVGARLRRSLQRLGITYIKLGQFMAMRFDILPEEVCRELGGLFDKVSPLTSESVRQTLEDEFARPVEELFRDFNWECIAAASVAQVHRATTHDGETVAVKVQRPGIARIFAADIRNFRRAAAIGDYLRLLGPQSMAEAVDEFDRYTRREMDFITEGQTADRLRRGRGRHDTAPYVYWHLTTSRVLTMEFVDGYPLSEVIRLAETGRIDELREFAPGLDLDRAVQNLTRACLRQLFVTGFFHADPHPGNIFLRADDTIVFVDFGIFGQLTAERRETFASYIEHLAVGNVEQSYRHFVRLLQPTASTEMQQLRRDVYRIMYRWHRASQQPDADVVERHLGTYFSEFVLAIRANHVRMSMDTLLFWRALLTLDATALRFGDQFDLLGALRDFFTQTRPTPLERLTALATDSRVAGSLMRLKQESPAQVGRLAADLLNGGYRQPVSHSDSLPLRRRRDDNAGLVALTVFGSSLFVLAVKLPLEGTVQALLWIAAIICATATVVRLVRA